jgi:hypothetical protein
MPDSRTPLYGTEAGGGEGGTGQLPVNAPAFFPPL